MEQGERMGRPELEAVPLLNINDSYLVTLMCMFFCNINYNNYVISYGDYSRKIIDEILKYMQTA